MPRYRTPDGVVVQTSAEVAQFLRADPIGGEDTGDAARSTQEATEAEPQVATESTPDAQASIREATDTQVMTAAAPQPQASTSLSDGDYEEWTVAELKDEVRRRNSTFGDGERLPIDRNKAELVQILRDDDEQTKQ